MPRRLLCQKGRKTNDEREPEKFIIMIHRQRLPSQAEKLPVLARDAIERGEEMPVQYSLSPAPSFLPIGSRMSSGSISGRGPWFGTTGVSSRAFRAFWSRGSWKGSSARRRFWSCRSRRSESRG